jgi:tetratricopeptide (TPR) repeat protein
VASSTANDQKQLQDAFFLFQQGRLAEAAGVYEQLIKRNPENFDALHYLGILKATSGQIDEAKHLIERSLATPTANLSYIENYASILFKIGDFQKAAQVCETALKKYKTTESLQYVLAIALHKSGRLKEADDAFTSLLQVHPDHLAGNNEKGATLAELRQFEEALHYVDRALRLQRGYPEGLLNRGNILNHLRKYQEAITAFDDALNQRPNMADAHLGRGNALRRLGRYADAFIAYDKAIALNPGLAEAWLGRGNAHTELRQFDEALAAFNKAIAFKPDLAEAWLGRGNVFAECKKVEDAAAAYDKALGLNPDSAGALLGRGNILVGLRRFDEALAVYDKALASEPDLAEAWLARGNVLTEQKRFDDASAAYQKAIGLSPDLAGAWLGRGNVDTDLNRFNEALATYDHALALEPDLVEAWIGRGNAYSGLARYDDACAAYDKAISLDRANADAYLNKALVDLCLGKFEEGWDLYEWRWLSKEHASYYPILKSLNCTVRQDRIALKGRKVSILSEQGVGDEIMFGSILPDLVQDAASVSCEVDPRLVRLFARAFPDVSVVPRADHDHLKNTAFDVVLQSGSLGYAYRRGGALFKGAPYLSAEPELVKKWKEHLAKEAGSRMKIGLSWRGGTDRTRRNDRSVELSRLKSILNRDDLYFVSLQYGKVDDEIQRCNQDPANLPLHCLLNDFNNFDEFAALITTLDLVVSVQNTTVHMCGALGKSCWGMIPWRPEWRYGNDPRRMVWYSSISLYRQQSPGDWDGVIDKITADLTSLGGNKDG